MQKIREWINKPASFKRTDNGVTIHAEPGTDYFNDPCSANSLSNGHVLAVKAPENFTFQCTVTPEFGET